MKTHLGSHNTSEQITNGPVREKANNMGSDQVRYKPDCTVTEDEGEVMTM